MLNNVQEKIKKILNIDEDKKLDQFCLNCLEAQCRRQRINLNQPDSENLIRSRWTEYISKGPNDEYYKKMFPDCEYYFGPIPWRMLFPFFLKRCLSSKLPKVTK